MFEGKIAVVTGAARGIGQAIAFDLAAKGAGVVVCDIKEEWLEETAEGIRKLGREVWCRELDVTNTEAVQNVFPRLLKRQEESIFLSTTRALPVTGC